MPNQPKTPRKSFRVSDDLWAAALVEADANGESVSDVLRRALERYVKRSQSKRKGDAA